MLPGVLSVLRHMCVSSVRSPRTAGSSAPVAAFRSLFWHLLGGPEMDHRPDLPNSPQGRVLSSNLGDGHEARVMV